MTTLQVSSMRTVAFLDILGFRQAVLTTPLSKLADKYERHIAQADAMNSLIGSESSLFPGHPPNVPWCQRYIFSDSIILVSVDDQATSALKLLIYAWRLNQVFIAFKMPLRGGIAFGEIYTNPLKNICLGRALTTAYDFERNQAWIGTAIHPSVVNQFPQILSPENPNSGLLDDIFLKYPVPMKDNTTQQLKTLNWRFNLIVENGTRSLFASEGSVDIMQKVTNTLKYAETIVRSGRIYAADPSKLPSELQAMWVGDKEPPFPHGDDL